MTYHITKTPQSSYHTDSRAEVTESKQVTLTYAERRLIAQLRQWANLGDRLVVVELPGLKGLRVKQSK